MRLIPADRMDAYALKETFEAVVMPMLQAEVLHFPDDSEFSAFAIKSVAPCAAEGNGHPVRSIRKTSPSSFRCGLAQKLVDAKTDEQKQAAVLDAEGVPKRRALFAVVAGGRARRGVEREVHSPAAGEEVRRDLKCRDGCGHLGQSNGCSQPDKDHAHGYADLHPGGVGKTATRQ